ncbi:MAG: hypothetical protein ACQKBT_07130 [Puniceicoccales bacterium]
MNKKILLIPIISAVLVGGLSAQQGPDKGPRGRSGPPSPEQMLERFDANEDGVIDLEEIEMVFSQKQERPNKREAKQDDQCESCAKDGKKAKGGKKDKEQARQKGKKRDGAQMSEVIVEKFDTDGDGLLSAEELQVFFAEAHSKRQAGPGGPRGPQE